MPEPFSSHYLRLYWGGGLWYATAIRRSVSSATEVDVTGMNSTITSDPANTNRKMIWREVESCVADSGEVSIDFLAQASDVSDLPDQIGHKRLLQVRERSASGQETANNLISYQAILTKCDIDANVGEYVRGSLTFRLSGYKE